MVNPNLLAPGKDLGRELSLFLENILESSTEYSIIGLDAEGTIILWNAGARRWYGYEAGEVVGKAHVSLLHPPEDRAARKHLEIMKVAREAGKWEGVLERPTRDGGRFTARVVTTPRRDSEGNLVGYLTISKNIAEELRLERERRESEEKVKMLNRELEAFSYSVSHDLRSPLRHIDGFVDLLMKSTGDSLDEKSRRYLSIIAESAQQMGQLIDDLLVFSRMGRTEMHEKVIDMTELLQETLENLQPEMEAREIVWKLASLPKVPGDAAMLRQVFLNLIGNAIKYTRGRTPAEIEVGCTEEPEEWVFHVRDNGAGFDMEYSDKLFGVFQRLHRPDEFEGTGIGLANVKRIITRHRGRVWATGKVGEGAAFYFSLPKTRSSRNRDEPQNDAPRIEQNPPR